MCSACLLAAAITKFVAYFASHIVNKGGDTNPRIGVRFMKGKYFQEHMMLPQSIYFLI